MSTDNRISIIIPVYNAAAYLQCCQDSLVKQKDVDLEIIYVDDGSTDRSPTLLARLAAEDARIRVLSGPNGGTLAARKRGVAASTGQWCLFLDPDDWLADETCARVLAQAGGVDIVSFGAELRPEQGVEIPHREDLDRYFNPAPGQIGGTTLVEEIFNKHRAPGNVCCKLIDGAICRAAFAEAVDVYSVFAEDLYAGALVAHRAARGMRIIGDRLYQYRVGSGISTRKTISAASFRRGLGALEMGYDLMKRYPGKSADDFNVKLLGDMMDMAVARSESAADLRENLVALLQTAHVEVLSRLLLERARRRQADQDYIGELEDELLHLRASPFAGPKAWIKEMLHHD